MPDRGDDGSGAVGGGRRAQRATGSPCATPRSRPHRDGSPPCFLSDISGWSLSLVGGPPRRLLAAVADSVLANAGSGRRWRGQRRRASSRLAADRAAEIPGRRASRGLCKNDIRGASIVFARVLSRVNQISRLYGVFKICLRERAGQRPVTALYYHHKFGSLTRFVGPVWGYFAKGGHCAPDEIDVSIVAYKTSGSAIDRDGRRSSVAGGACRSSRRHWRGVTLSGEIAEVLSVAHVRSIRVHRRLQDLREAGRRALAEREG